MAEVQRRSTIANDERRTERRKSGIFFFNRSFKKSSTSGSGEDVESSSPTTPTLGPSDAHSLKRRNSTRSIPALAQTTAVTIEGANVPSPTSASLSLANNNTAGDSKGQSEQEDLPTPPETPAPASTAEEEATGEEAPEAAAAEEEAPVLPFAEVETRVSFHEEADLHIKVTSADGSDAAVYSVVTSALQNASSTWKATLTTTTTTTSDDSTLEWPTATSPSALAILFSIAHYRFRQLPRALALPELYDLVLLAYHSQTLPLLTPFLANWLATTEPAIDTPLAAEQTLVTGYLLGLPSWVQQALTPVAHHAQLSPENALLTASGTTTEWSSLPIGTNLPAQLASIRLTALQNIITAASAPVHRLLNPGAQDDTIQYCRAPEGDPAREECEQLQLGSALMGLTKARLWPAPEATRWKGSVVELASAYAGVRMRRFGGGSSGLRFQEGEEKEKEEDAHARCGLGQRDAVEEVLGAKGEVCEEVLEEVKVNAKEMGLDE